MGCFNKSNKVGVFVTSNTLQIGFALEDIKAVLEEKYLESDIIMKIVGLPNIRKKAFLSKKVKMTPNWKILEKGGYEIPVVKQHK